MAANHSHTDAFRGARFTMVDLTGATFHSCDLRHVKVVDSWLTDVNLSGLVENFLVNDVDVAPLVEAELDRRQPERLQLRAMQSPDEYRAMWATLDGLW
ncbi:MAG TPA: pentapeptide repeat-containing protein, partial [Acidimicrobiales bacterium]|nr:pentapeptide repeat-containing protein [Acidimicrobiales bacterium]